MYERSMPIGPALDADGASAVRRAEEQFKNASLVLQNCQNEIRAYSVHYAELLAEKDALKARVTSLESQVDALKATDDKTTSAKLRSLADSLDAARA